MKNSRQQIIAEIALMDRTLQYQRNQVIEHKEYFVQGGVNRSSLSTLILLASAFFIGWNAGRKKWNGKIMQQAMEIGTLASVNYFKKMLIDFFK